MITIRETPADKLKEERLLQVFSKHLGLEYQQCFNTKKYRIDGWLFDDSNEVKAWVECKWYGDGKKAFCALNAPKYLELTELSRSFGLPSYLIFRENDKWGYIKLHDGTNHLAKTKVKITGGTQKGRTPNPDDIEPLVILDKNKIVWGN